MKHVVFSPTFVKKLKTLSIKDKNLLIKIKKQLHLFQLNPQHPSLRLHKLKGDLKDVWSISVTKSFRIIFEDSNTYYFFDMGEHTYIYR